MMRNVVFTISVPSQSTANLTKPQHSVYFLVGFHLYVYCHFLKQLLSDRSVNPHSNDMAKRFIVTYQLIDCEAEEYLCPA